MRVMCVNEKWKPAPGLENVSHPQLGDIDVVTEAITEADTDFVYYRLARFGLIWYRADMFATLPDTPAEVIEETELQTA